MSRFEILTAPPGAGATGHILREHVLSRMAGEGLARDFAYLAPTRRKVERVRREIMELSGGGLFGPCVLTLDEFFKLLFERAGAPGAVISDIARLAVLESVIRDNAPSLRHLAAAAHYPGTVRKLGALFAEFKQNLIFSKSALEQRFADARGAIPGKKIHDLLLLFDAYNARLRAGGDVLLDTEDMFAHALRRLESHGADALPSGLRLIVLDGFYDFNPLQRAVLAAAVRAVPDAVARLEIEPPAPGLGWRHRRIFWLAQHTLGFYRSLRGRGAMQRPAPEAAPAPAPIAMRQLAGRLFLKGAFRNDKIDAGGAVLVLAPRDRAAEAHEIARRIKRLQSPRLSRTAVVFPALDAYAPLIREIFPEYGIPFEISAGRALAGSPVCVALLDAIEAAAENFPRTAVFRFLSSPFTDVAGLCADAPHAHEIDAVAREAGIAGGGGPAPWRDALERLAGTQEYVAQKHAEGAPERAACEDKAQLARRAAACLDAVFGALEPLRGGNKLTPADFAAAVRALIGGFGIRERAAHYDPAVHTAADARAGIRALAAFENVLDDVRAGLELTAGAHAHALPAEDLADMFRAALSGAVFHDAPRARGGVQVMGILETRGLDFDHVFLGGMLDDHFPKKQNVDFFLTASEREQLGIASIRTDISEDRFLFYRLFLTTKNLVITYPAQDSGRDTVRSMFIDELDRHIEIGDPREAPLFSRDNQTLYSPADCLARLGEHLRSATPDAAPPVRFREGVARRAARAAGMERDRRANTALSPFQGVIADPWHLERVRALFAPPRNTAGATLLENYARCPFRFFMSAILNAAPLEEVDEDISARDRGTLIHEILEAFYAARFDEAAGRIAPVPASPDTDAETQLLEIAKIKLEKYSGGGVFREAFRDSLLRGLHGYGAAPGPPGILKNFLYYEANDKDWFKPRYLEAAFRAKFDETLIGNTSITAPPLDVTLSRGGVFRISGKIDRIDLDAAGGRFFIVDYKTGTGAPRTPSDLFQGINTGRDFQLPLYLLMAARALGPGVEPVGAALYSVNPLRDRFGKKAFFANADYRDKSASGKNALNTRAVKGFLPADVFHDALENRFPENMRYALDCIMNGYFHVDVGGADRQCGWCESRRVCRLDERHATRVRERAALEPIPAYLPRPLVDEANGNEKDY